MTDPSNSTYTLHELTAPQFNEAWNELMAINISGTPSMGGHESGGGQETPAQRNDTTFQGITAPVEAQYDRSVSNWSSSERSRPISTPPTYVDQPSTTMNTFASAPSYGFPGSGLGRSWYPNMDGTRTSPSGLGYYSYATGANFEQQPAYANLVAGNGGVNTRQLAAMTPSLDSASTNQYQNLLPSTNQYQAFLSSANQYQNLIPYQPHPYHPATYPIYPDRVSMVYQAPAVSNFGFAPSTFCYRSPYATAVPPPPPRMGTDPNDASTTTLGQMLPPFRSTAKEETAISHAAPCLADQPTPPTDGSGSIYVPGEPTQSESTVVPTTCVMVACDACGRRYINEQSYHNHWLRVHVLQTLTQMRKRKYDEIDAGQPKIIDRDAIIRSSVLMQMQKATPTFMDAVPPKILETPSLKIQRTDSMISVRLKTAKDSGETSSTITSAETQPEFSATTIQCLKSNASQMGNVSAESNPALDLTAKQCIGGLASRPYQYQGNPAAMSFLTSLLQSPQSRAPVITMPSRPMETKSQTPADCLSVNSPHVRMAFILPPGILSNQQAQTKTADVDQQSESSSSNGDESGSDPKIFQCSHCSKCYKSRRSMQKHIRTKHGSSASSVPISPPTRSIFEDVAAMESNEYGCPSCPKRFPTEISWKIHNAFHLRGDKPK